MLVAFTDLLYNALVVPLGGLLGRLAALGSPKWKQWQQEVQSTQDWPGRKLSNSPVVWIHAASMGEFEQLLPVVQHLREEIEDLLVVATITSPSGIDHARSSEQVDHALLLPLDRRSTMRRLVAKIKPTVVVVSRYDLWRNLIRELSSRKTPVYLINATLPSARGIPMIGAWVVDTYARLAHIDAVSPKITLAFQALLPAVACQFTPDTRSDGLLHRNKAGGLVSLLQISQKPTLVIGSSWEQDERLILEACTEEIWKTVRIVIAPHEVTAENLSRIAGQFNAQRLSELTENADCNVVVDSLGILVELYAAGSAAYVGGGFGTGVHSTTEPAVRGIPVACGPAIERSSDALELQEAGILEVVRTAPELQAWISKYLLSSTHDDGDIHEKAHAFMEQRLGASKLIADRITGVVTAQS